MNFHQKKLFPVFIILSQLVFFLHIAVGQTKSIDLSPAEKSFLAKYDTITYCVDPNFMPYEQINAQNRHEGLFADFLSLIATKAGFKFILVPTDNYQQSQEFFRQGRCMVIAGDSIPEEKVDFFYTNPYYTAESAFAVHINLPDDIHFKDIASGKTGYIEGANLSLLIKNYPSLNLISVDSDLNGIRKVASGELDSFVSTMATIDYTIRNYGITQVKIGGKIVDEVNFVMYVHKDFPMLVTILNKAIDSITAREKQAITQRWFQPTTRIKRTNKWLKRMLVLSFGMLFLFFLGYLLQRNRVIKTLEANETALRSSKERFDLAMRATNDGLWDWDMKTNQVYFSPRWKSMLGYMDHELENSFATWTQLADRAGMARIMSLIKNCRDGIAYGFETEFQMRHKSGHWVDILCRSTIVRDENGYPSRMVGTHVDLSDKKRLEEQLRQSQKMESLGTLAGGIAHDFNNILAPILGFTELLLEGTAPSDSAADSLKEIKRAAERAKNLVNQILVFSRKKEQSRRPVYPHIIVKETLNLLRSTLPKTIEIRSEISSDCGMILGDPAQLEQIVMNLCTNAYHSMREKGGILGVSLKSLEISETDQKVFGRELSPGPYIDITVSDTGCGMDDHTINRIFEPYFTTKNKGEGTGLGLASVHGTVKSYGGHISVYSEVGQGSAFHVYLPAAEENVGLPDMPENDPKQVLPGGNERLLVVDDEEPITRLLNEQLEMLGYQVSVCTDSGCALEFFRDKPDGFDLLITDMTMPQYTGLDLSKKVLEVRPDMPIILCTGFSELINKEQVMSLGIRDFLIKPVPHTDLAIAIRKALKKG